MKDIFKFIFVLFLVGFLSFPAAIYAQDKEEKKEDPEKTEKQFGEYSWLSRGQKLGPWYLVSSKFYDPHPKQLLYHIDTGFSYSELSGNVEGEIWSVNGKLILRKAPITSTSSYDFSRNKTTILAFGSTNVVEKESFTEVFSYDILKWLALEGGGAWFNDSAKFYGDSYSFFGGVSVWPINKRNLWLKLSVFGAFAKLTYQNDRLESSFISMPDYESPGIFFQETFNWQITKMVSFTQYADYTYSFDEADPSLIFGIPRAEEDNVIRWNLKATVNVALTSSIYLYTAYSIVHDENPLADTQASLINYDEDDTTLSVGFKVVW